MGHNIKTKCFFFWLQEWESCPAAASFPLAVRGPRRGQVQWPVLQAVCHSSQRWDSFLHPGEWAWPLLARHSKAAKGSLFRSSRGSRALFSKLERASCLNLKHLWACQKQSFVCKQHIPRNSSCWSGIWSAGQTNSPVSWNDFLLAVTLFLAIESQF